MTGMAMRTAVSVSPATSGVSAVSWTLKGSKVPSGTPFSVSGERLDDDVVAVDAEEHERHEQGVELVERAEFGAGDGVGDGADVEAHLQAEDAGRQREADEDEVHRHPEGEPEQRLR